MDPRVERTLAELVAEGTLTEEQAARVAARLAAVPAAARGRSARLTEVAGYAGGALVGGAALLFLVSEWAGLRPGERAGVLAGAAALLLGAGAAVAATAGPRPGRPVRLGRIRDFVPLGRIRDAARRRLVSTLWTLAAAAAGSAAAVAVDGDWLLVASAVGLAVAVPAYAAVPSMAGQAGVWLGTVGLVAAAADDVVTGVAQETAVGLALILVGAVWAGLAVRRVWREPETGLTLAAGTALLGAQLPLGADEWLAYALTAGVAAAGFGGYVLARSWPVLATGVLATTLVIPEALHDWTSGSLTLAGALLVAGLTLLAASTMGLRLRGSGG